MKVQDLVAELQKLPPEQTIELSALMKLAIGEGAPTLSTVDLLGDALERFVTCLEPKGNYESSFWQKGQQALVEAEKRGDWVRKRDQNGQPRKDHT